MDANRLSNNVPVGHSVIPDQITSTVTIHPSAAVPTGHQGSDWLEVISHYCPANISREGCQYTVTSSLPPSHTKQYMVFHC